MTQTWRFGDTTVTRIEEQLGPGSFPPHEYFSGFEPAVLARELHWLVPHHALPGGQALVTSVHSWLIRTPRHTIVLDCCSGNHKDRPWWPRFHQLDTPFLQRLAAAGARPEDVDIVLCTHLHADHIGWNTRRVDGRWVPTFPNARYLIGRTEGELWNPALHPGDDDPHRRIAWADSVLPVLEAGQVQWVDGEHAIDDTLVVEPAPGHTAGHVLLKLLAGVGGVFCGDVIHHPLQVVAPQWNSRFCALPEAARATRRRVLEHCCERGACLLPTHFGWPHVARVQAEGDGFRPAFVPPEPP